MKNYFFIFITSLITGTTIALSASSWMTAWLGLEINLLSIMPILLLHSKATSTESAIKYFIIQAGASTLMIISTASHIMTFNNNFISWSMPLISVALAIKAALAPMHLWLPQLIEHTEWQQTSILLTWQKIAPLWLLSFSTPMTIYSTLIILSALMGSLGGVLTHSVKKIVTFSSITHSSWMLTAVILNKILWGVYFLMYTLMLISLTFFFILLNIKSINSIPLNSMSSLTKLSLVTNTLSIAGLPPLLGFFPKLLIIQTMLKAWPSMMVIASLILATLISLFFYLKIILTISLDPLINKPSQHYLNTKLTYLATLNLTGNFVIPTTLLMF